MQKTPSQIAPPACQRNGRQLDFFKALHEIGKAINSTQRLDRIMDLIVQKMNRLMGLKGCTLRLTNPSDGHLELMAACGLSATYLDRGSIDDDLSTSAALRGEPVIMTDATTDPRNRYRDQTRKEGVVSILVAPIVVRQRIIGVLRLLTGHRRRFSRAEVNFTLAVAEQGGIAIQNAKNREEIERLTEGQKAKQRLQGIVEMAGTVAHELNNPLATAILSAEMLGKSIGVKQKGELETLQRNLKRMRTLIERMTRLTGYRTKEYLTVFRSSTLKTTTRRTHKQRPAPWIWTGL